jgi:hypothetical protein
MSEPILILGDSGAGKSFSCRNLDPATTLLVSVEGKRYPFSMKGWKKISKEEPDGSFYCPPKVDSYAKIKAAVKAAVDNGKKTIVIDDSQFLMQNEFFNKAFEKGYDKFTSMAYNFHDLVTWGRSLPDDVTVYFLHHLEFDNESRIKVKTVGKMLDSQTNIAGKVTICIYATLKDSEYCFMSKVDNQPIIKAPPEMFEPTMDNDLAAVDASVREYWGI